MPNPFDRFDQVRTRSGGGNPFDRFDGPHHQPRNGPARNPAGNSGGRSRLRADDSLSELRTMSGGFLEGIPVVGPMIRGGVERAAAGTLAALSPDKEYAEVLKTIQEGTHAEKQANPTLDTASQIAGAVAGTIPMVMAAPAAFGAGAGGLGVRSGISTVAGSALGGTDAAVRSGGDADAIQLGTLVGGAAGAAGPVAGQLIGKGINAARDAWTRSGAAKSVGMTSKALTQALKAMQADGLDPAMITQRLRELGENGMLMDAGPNLQQQAAGLVALPGEARGIIKSAVSARDATANQRIRAAVDHTLGPAPLPSQIDETISAGQEALSPAYEQVLRNSRRVDTTNIAHRLESEAVNLRGRAQQAVQRVRGMLNITGTDQLDPNPRTLFETRKAIDGMIANETDTNALRVLGRARREVDDELARAVPGIKEVDAPHAELSRQREAVGRGQQVLDSGRTAPRPQELAQEVRQGALPQGRQIGPSAAPMRLRQGARAEIERIVGTNANDRVALQRLIKGEGDWNRERLATLFGQDRADRLIRVLDNERTFAETSHAVTKNSASAERIGAMNELRGESGGFGVVDSYKAGGTAGIFRAGAVKGLGKAAAAVRSGGDEASNATLARALTTEDRNRIVTALMRANGGRRVPQSEIDAAVRAFMIGGGTSAVGAYGGR